MINNNNIKYNNNNYSTEMNKLFYQIIDITSKILHQIYYIKYTNDLELCIRLI